LPNWPYPEPSYDSHISGRPPPVDCQNRPPTGIRGWSRSNADEHPSRSTAWRQGSRMVIAICCHHRRVAGHSGCGDTPARSSCGQNGCAGKVGAEPISIRSSRNLSSALPFRLGADSASPGHLRHEGRRLSFFRVSRIFVRRLGVRLGVTSVTSPTMKSGSSDSRALISKSDAGYKICAGHRSARPAEKSVTPYSRASPLSSRSCQSVPPCRTRAR